MNIPNLMKPSDPRFSCGPTKKPEGWSLDKLNELYLGRYHRSEDVKIYILKQLERINKILRVPDNFKTFLIPGSCTGATEAVIWSLLGEREITTIIYDYWGMNWYEDMKKLDYRIDCRSSLDGSMPNLDKINSSNDVIFVWTGTTTGMSINQIDFLDSRHEGLVISDITSAAFIYDLPWHQIDVGIFSWQKALGSESQHGIVIMSPKAISRLKKRPVPKIFDFLQYNYLINTPSLLTLSDLEMCLDSYERSGGLDGNIKNCKQNKLVLDLWVKKNNYLRKFVKEEKYEALTPSYFTFLKKIDYEFVFKFLIDNNIAYDIKNYRKTNPGIRIWTGPTIKKNDLIALTNWLDWCFNELVG